MKIQCLIILVGSLVKFLKIGARAEWDGQILRQLVFFTYREVKVIIARTPDWLRYLALVHCLEKAPWVGV